MLVLSIDTAFKAGGAALALEQDGKTTILGEVTLNTDTTHSRRLLSLVELLLEQTGHKKSDLSGVAVTVGPGYFTGLRIGLATAQGIAFGLNLPCVPVSTLRLLASGIGPCNKPVWAVADARRQLVYAACFKRQNGQLERLTEDTAMSPKHLADLIEQPCVLVGDGARAYAENFKDQKYETALSWQDIPRPGLLALLGVENIKQGKGVEPSLLRPRYVRPSDAEIRFGLPLDEYRLVEDDA